MKLESYLPWITLYILILTAFVIPAISGVWRLTLRMALMEQTLREHAEKDRQMEEDIALVQEGAKMRQEQLEVLKQTLAGMNEKLAILVNRSGINLPPIQHTNP